MVELTHKHTLTLLQHARLPALAQPALLALASHVQVHLAVAVVLAGVLGALDDAAPEEALAALAAQHVVVEPRGLVAAHAAHLVAQHLGGGALLPFHRLAICIQIFKKLVDWIGVTSVMTGGGELYGATFKFIFIHVEIESECTEKCK